MYSVIAKRNEWNRFGAPINVEEAEVLQTADLREAFTVQRQHTAAAGKGATYARHAESFRVVDETGAQVFLDTLYAQVVGPLTFAALESLPLASGWWINLDVWFDAGCVA